MIDVVIPLGDGSPSFDIELRYALRSIQKHLLGYRRVFIVGQLPDWCHNVVHLPFPDKSKYKQRNIFRKIMHACNDELLSDDFMFFNDDHYLLMEEQACDYPYYAHGTIEAEIARCKGEYKRSLINTLSALRDLSTWNFDVHYPIKYNKEQFKNVMSFYNWNVPDGYVIKSLYCNTLNIQPVMTRDGKIHDGVDPEKLDELASTRTCISTSNYALTNFVRRKLESLYPEKSVYER